MKLARLLTVALSVAALFASASSANAPQKPTTAQPTQAQLEDRINKLQVEFDEAKLQAKSAALDNDYIKRVQEHYQSFYEKVLYIQIWTLGVLGLILAVIIPFAARFSFKILEERNQRALKDALADLEKNFSEKMQTELATMRKENTEQLKILEDGLKQQIRTEVTNLEGLSDFAFYFSQGLSFDLAKEFKRARVHFRAAVNVIAENPEIFEREPGLRVLSYLLKTFQEDNPQTFAEEAKKELADPLYRKFENELALLAIDMPELAPLLTRN